MVRRLRSAAGTVEQAATPVTSTLSPASRPRNIRPSSSAVDRASVLTRQLCTSLSPSKVARTVLVFPMSMQSSTRAAYPAESEPFEVRASAGPQVQGDVQDRGGVGQGSDRQVVDAG